MGHGYHRYGTFVTQMIIRYDAIMTHLEAVDPDTLRYGKPAVCGLEGGTFCNRVNLIVK